MSWLGVANSLVECLTSTCKALCLIPTKRAGAGGGQGVKDRGKEGERRNGGGGRKENKEEK